METLADLNASGSNLAPHMQIRTREQMCLHASLRLSCTSDLCRRWRYTSENWDSFNCSMNAAIDTFVDTVTFCVETKQKIRSKHVYIHTWVQHSSILARAETSETWKTSCPPGMEGLGSAWTRASLNPGAAWSQRHSDKHTTTGCTAYASSGRIFTEN